MNIEKMTSDELNIKTSATAATIANAMAMARGAEAGSRDACLIGQAATAWLNRMIDGQRGARFHDDLWRDGAVALLITAIFKKIDDRNAISDEIILAAAAEAATMLERSIVPIAFASHDGDIY
jgi:hypothetical protein